MVFFFLLLRLRIYVHNVFQDPVCGILGDLLAGVKYNVIIIFSLAYNHLKQRQTLLCFVLHCNEPFPCAGGMLVLFHGAGHVPAPCFYRMEKHNADSGEGLQLANVE